MKSEELWRGEVEASTPQNGTESKGVGGGGGRFPDPEVSKRPVRRSFSTGYKRRILEEASRCCKPGELGALLRREGLYSSTLTGWRRQLAAGVAWGLAPKPRGPKPRWANPLAGEVEQDSEDNDEEMQVFSKVTRMGNVGSPRDFIYILNVIRHALGR